ncbi:MAG: S8 family serine peptidase, partial [Chloroflexota bacterium]|nr:S8 family serine peptidase [Chloroflexota bacterium]
PAVAYAEPERVRYAFASSNDPQAWRQWGQSKIQAPRGWSIARGSTKVKIAIVDSGVDFRHPDLRYRYAGGRDFVNNDGTPEDGHGHGTHVAGIATATGNNSVGIAGVGWYTKILGVKVLNSRGEGTDSAVSRGIRWSADNGAAVINLSLGGPGYSQTLADAVSYAQRKGALLVAAAGNEGANVATYPASLPGVVGVAATNRYDTDAWYSNFGSYVDISAPGGAGNPSRSQDGIYSTLPGNRYGYADGTSMASPFVAGAAAVIKGKYPWMNAAKLWERLRVGADDIGVSGKDVYSGYGRLNLFRSLAIPGHVYGTVTNARTGRPLTNNKISLKGTTRYVRTDAYGRYRMSLVPYGTRTIVASRYGYESRSRTFTMPANGRVALSFSLRPLAKLTGRVRTSSGTALSGVTVKIVGTSRAARSNSSGYYTINYAPLGTRNVTAARSGYYTRTRSVTLLMGSTTTLNFGLNPR